MALKSASDVTIRDGKAWKRWEHREGHWERLCWSEACDGNRDDPSYAYCGLPLAHAGEHGNWHV